MTLLRPQVEAFVNAVYIVARGSHGKNCICSEEKKSEWLPGFEKKIEKATKYLESQLGDDPGAQVLRLFSKQGVFDVRGYGLDKEVFNRSRRDFVDNLHAAVHSERAIMQHHLGKKLALGEHNDQTTCQVVWLSAMVQMNNGVVIADLLGDRKGRKTILDFNRRNRKAFTAVRVDCCRFPSEQC